MRQVSIDALPLLFVGGVSNYVRPLVENIVTHASPEWHVELFFRLNISRYRWKSYHQYSTRLKSFSCSRRLNFLPDFLLEKFWKHDLFVSPLKSKGQKNIFLSTTELVPRRSNSTVGWIVYDLIPLLIPQYFSVNKEAALGAQRKTAQQTDFIIAISENTKKDVINLLNYPEEKTCVIYPGATTSKTLSVPNNSSAHFRPYVYYLGSLALNKNVDGMLRIFARCIHEHNLDIDIILTGKDFCGRSFWDRLIRELDIEERVRFTGWVEGDTRKSLLVNAVMLWQFSWYEGFGLPVLEAASSGIPVLYTNRGAVPEILQNPEQEIDPSDEKEAAARAAAALQSPETLQRWKEWGLLRASEFSWDRSALKLLTWLETQF